MGASLHYLTIQDVVWINFAISNRVNKFHYAKLEEAVNYQYGYGSSTDLPRQASQFAKGLAKLKPFTEGNDATALIAVAAFLELNGYRLTAAADLSNFDNLSIEESDAHHGHGGQAVKALVRGVMDRFSNDLQKLSQSAVA